MALIQIPGGNGIPPEPDWSQTFNDPLEIALLHETWGHVVREMTDAETISVTVGHAIFRLCIARVFHERALRDVAEHGAIIRAPKTGVPMHSPYWVVVRQTHDDMTQLEGHLGISPLKRGKVTKSTRRQKPQRAADRYLGKGPA